jgi:GH3 auxin-responsive promoter
MIDATPWLITYAQRRLASLARLDPVHAQARELDWLLQIALHTRFATAHRFADIRSVAEYQSAVKLRQYQAFWERWWRPHFPVLRDVTWPGLINYFAESSGTSTGVTKYIPVSHEMIRANRRAALDVLVFHTAARPHTRILGGKTLVLGGSTALRRLAPGVWSGDLSGIAATKVPFWARNRVFPPRDIALIPDWERKIALVAERALAEDIRGISGTPSWLLLFFERLAALRPNAPRRLVEFFPNLELLVHGGVGFAPYAESFSRWLEGSHAETREVYPCSEGFVAIADRGPGDGLRLILDNGLFYEFVPAEQLDDPAPVRHWIANAEIGRNYALVVTSNAGLWSYVLGDTVELTGLDPPRLRITGRITYDLSAFGEHLTGAELDAAIAAAAASVGTRVIDYAATALAPTSSEPRGGHLFIVEFDPANADVDPFARALDSALAHGNADYAVHRQGDFGMLPPRVGALPAGGFAAWMASRGKLGGQHKVPRVIHDPALLADLRRFAGDAD